MSWRRRHERPRDAVIRSRPTGEGHLLIATPIAGRGRNAAVLSVGIDLERLLSRVPVPAASPSPMMIVDLATADVVAGMSRAGSEDEVAIAPMAPQRLAAYAEGIPSGYEAGGSTSAPARSRRRFVTISRVTTETMTANVKGSANHATAWLSPSTSGSPVASSTTYAVNTTA